MISSMGTLALQVSQDAADLKRYITQEAQKCCRSAMVCDTCNVSLPERHRRRSIRNPAPAWREASRAKRESPVRPRPLPCEGPIRRTISDPVRWCIPHTHLAGNRPFSRQMEHFLAHLTGYDGDCRSVPAMTERVRGDGGEEGKRVPTIFFLEEETFSLFAKGDSRSGRE